jgi:hypothetical protein
MREERKGAAKVPVRRELLAELPTKACGEGKDAMRATAPLRSLRCDTTVRLRGSHNGAQQPDVDLSGKLRYVTIVAGSVLAATKA